MATNNSAKKPCCRCNKGGATFTCDGCHLSFCLQHVSDHRQELSLQLDNIGQQHDILKRDIDQHNINQTLLIQINEWETKSIAKIKSTAEAARENLQALAEQLKNRLNGLMKKLSDELRSNRENDDYTEYDLDRWVKQLEQFSNEMKIPSKIELLEDNSSFLRLIKIKSSDKQEQNKTDMSSQNARAVEEKHNTAYIRTVSSHNDYPAPHTFELPTRLSASAISQSSTYPSVMFGLHESTGKDMRRLFTNLMLLDPMNKDGPMNGKCSLQTDQMEQFLAQTFGFKNNPGEYIVQGVKSFRLGKPPHKMLPRTVIHFPSNTDNLFAMTVKEIIEWQHSYKVYAGKGMKGMTKAFLRKALKGLSSDGEEAFRMKFVVRISTCPILMEFDAKIISRNLNEDWPNRIKLVSVTGIDFAGRKHDVDDILCYISNWKEVFEIDHARNEPALVNERDFWQKKGGRLGELNETRLLRDLTYMARLRLRACDAEGVQIVVETGIGLGVFSGKQIGVDTKVRITSAIAIRTALEEDGPSYKNIRAIVFALPIFNPTRSNYRVPNTFDDFVEQFQEPVYNGPIPVLIADQDMHRLTVAIARQGFIVSELNSTDSHGVFGEYWQNRGPALEEKLALTTVGLLVQHHLINPEVLNPNNYHLI